MKIRLCLVHVKYFRKINIFQKCYFRERKIFSNVLLHFKKCFEKYFLMFCCVLENTIENTFSTYWSHFLTFSQLPNKYIILFILQYKNTNKTQKKISSNPVKLREEGRERGNWVRRKARSRGGGEGEIVRCSAASAISAKARSRSARCCDDQTRFKREREIEKERDRRHELRTQRRDLAAASGVGPLHL